MKRFVSISLLALSLCFLFILPSFYNDVEKADHQAYSKEYIEYLNSTDKSVYGGNIPAMYETNNYSISTYQATPSYYCLRDDYMIYTSYQGRYGLCWAYACNLSLETMIAINYNEFYNFSSAWSGLTAKCYWDEHGYPEYTVGGGGNINYYQYAVENFGLMLQSDFDLNDFYTIDNNNYRDFYNHYSSYAITDLGFDYSIVTYSNYPALDTIKSHIMTNGSLYASVKSTNILNETSLYSKTSGTSDHAVSIIGWDDSYKASTWDKAGAWIALNSWGDDWGNDGIFYISYHDAIASKAFHGFAPRSSDINVEVSSSNSTIDNKIVNKYKKGASTKSSTFDKQNNLFYEEQNISLSYGYTNVSNLNNIAVNVSKNGKSVNNELSSNSVNYNSNEITLKADSLSAGTYKVEIIFTLNNGSTKTITKNFVVLNGLEFDCLEFYTDATLNSDVTNQITRYLTNFNSFNQENVYFELFANKYAYLRFYLPTYSYLKSYNSTFSSNVKVSYSTAEFTPYNSSAYANGYIYFAINISDTTSSTSNVNFTFTNQDGTTKTYYFKIYNLGYNEATINYTYVTVDYNGATGNTTIPDKVVLMKNTNKYLPTPTKGNAKFDGWYTSPDFTESSKLSNNTSGYFLKYSAVSHSSGTNYMLDHYKDANGNSFTFNYLTLYAKWTDVKYSVTYEWKDINGNNNTETLVYNIDQCSSISLKEMDPYTQTGYTFKWTSGYSKIDYTNNKIKNLNEDITIYGEYVLTKPVISSAKIGNEETSNLDTTYSKKNSYTMSVSASHQANDIIFKYTWKKSVNGIFKELKNTNSSTYTVSQASDSGKYICEVVATNASTNSISDISTSEVFDIEIDKAQTVIDTTAIATEFTYDGQEHTITGATINHTELSQANIKYLNNKFTDVGTGIKKVTIIAPETNNYTYASKTLEIKINKAKVTIKIDNARGAVFSEHQPYSYEVKYGTVYNNEDLELEYITKATTYIAGSYEISAKSHNSNYDVEVISGTYDVYIEGFSLVLLIFGIVTFIGLAILLVYYIIKKRENDKYLKSSHFDDDVRFR